MLMGKEGVRHDDTRQPRWGTHASQLAEGRASSMGARGMCEPFGEPITPLTPAATNTAATRLDAPQRVCGTGQIDQRFAPPRLIKLIGQIIHGG